MKESAFLRVVMITGKGICVVPNSEQETEKK